MVLRDGVVVTTGEALNDVVVSGSMVGRMIQLEMYIDQHWATTYHADALIIATPTGSTAYALACGGPILPPELHNILVIPAAPHLSMDRPIVLSEGATVEILASSNSKNDIAAIVDGTILCLLREGDLVQVQASYHTSRFVRLRERNYFYRSLLDRLEPRVPRSAPENREKL
jgi:NAD+ kinase